MLGIRGGLKIVDIPLEEIAFISYSRDDKELVDDFCDLLKHLDMGIIIWKDTGDIAGGQYPLEEISDAIYKSRYYIVFLSKNSLKSSWVRKELRLAVTNQIQTGYPKVIPILIDIKQKDVPKFLRDIQNIPIGSEGIDFLMDQVRETIALEKHLKLDALMRIGQGVIHVEKMVLCQKHLLNYDEIKKGKKFKFKFSSLGTPTMVRIIDPREDFELDCSFEKHVSKGTGEISLTKEYDIDELDVYIETSISKEKIKNIIKIENHETKKEFFGYHSDVIIRNLSEFYIYNYPVTIKIKPIQLGISQLKKTEEIKRMKKTHRLAEKERRLMKFLDKHRNRELRKLSMFQMLGKSIFNIISHDPAFPQPQDKRIQFPKPSEPGEFSFTIDVIKPETTLSYEIMGLELAEIMEEEVKVKEIDKLDKFFKNRRRK